MSNFEDFERMAAAAAAQVMAELDAELAQQAPTAPRAPHPSSHPAVRRSARNRTASPFTPPTDTSSSPQQTTSRSHKRKTQTPASPPSSSKVTKTGTAKGKRPTSKRTTKRPAMKVTTTFSDSDESTNPTTNDSHYTLDLEIQVSDLTRQVTSLQDELETVEGAAMLLEMALNGTIQAQKVVLAKLERSQEKLRGRVEKAFGFENH